MSKKVYVKDSEGFVTQKLKSKMTSDEVIITKAEFEKLSGIEYYKETYTHGGARRGAGRKSEFKNRIRISIDLDAQELEFITSYARKHNISRNKALREAVQRFEHA